MREQGRIRGKMKLRWHGPYTVTKCSSDKNYEILINGQNRSYHIDLLKLYKEQDDNENDIDTDDEGLMTDVGHGVEIFMNNIGYLPVSDNQKNITVLKDCSDESVKLNVQNLISEYPNLYSNVSSITNVLSQKITLIDLTCQETALSSSFVLSR